MPNFNKPRTIVGWVIFLAAGVYLVWKYMQIMSENNEITTLMRVPLSGEASVYQRYVRQQVDPHRIIIANAVPALSGIVGFANPYTARYAIMASKMQNVQQEMVVHFIYLLETTPNISFTDAWTASFKMIYARPEDVPVHFKIGLPARVDWMSYVNLGLMLFMIIPFPK